MPAILLYALLLFLIIVLTFVAWQLWCAFVLNVFNPILETLNAGTVSTQICGRASNSLQQLINWIKHLKPPKIDPIDISISPVLLVQIGIVIALLVTLFLLWKVLNLFFNSIKEENKVRTSNSFLDVWDSFTTRLLIFFAGLNLTIRMILKGISSSQEKPKCAILFLAAEPTDQNRLRLAEEMREIEENLELGKHRESYSLKTRMALRPKDLIWALLKYRPTFVHFSGHGAHTGELIFEDESGRSLPMRPQVLSGIFHVFDRQIQCVILNACYSDKQAKAIARHIHYVIGTNQAVLDQAAIAFSVGFYQGVSEGESIKTSYELGKQLAAVHDRDIRFKLRFLGDK